MGNTIYARKAAWLHYIWTAEEYLNFLKINGWKVIHRKEMTARITLMYTECVKDGQT